MPSEIKPPKSSSPEPSDNEDMLPITTKDAAAADDIAKRRTLFIRSLSYSVTTEDLTTHFSYIAPLKHATVVIDPATNKSRGFGFVTFADAEDAQRAKKELNGTEMEGRKIVVDLADPRHRQSDAVGTEQKLKKEDVKKRAPRLIVRNLAWGVKKPQQLVKVFQSYGKVKNVIIPKKKNGEMSGFGFVTMRGYKNAERAVEAVNGKEIEGRTVAVDWAVEKEDWQQKQEKEAEIKEEAVKEESDAGSENENEGLVDDKAEESEDDLEAEDEDETEEGEEKEPENTQSDDSTTLFLRNLPFSTTDDILFEHFSQFGPVRYARVVMDPTTDRPRGTGFVNFYNTEDFETCLRSAPPDTIPPTLQKEKGIKPISSILQSEAADPTGRYTIDGRIISVTRAVDRSTAERLRTASAADREKRGADKRRLYLLTEGTMSASSPGYASLPPSEKALRESSLKQRKTLLQNDPNLHLSLTRLSVRNLPRWVTPTELKALARKAIPGFAEDVKEGRRQPISKEEASRDGKEGKEAETHRRSKGKGVVKQAKVQLEKAGGRSRGYGFIEYWSHRHALMGLRWLNGREVEGKGEGGKKRLIMEFAIENVNVVVRRKEREVKSREIASEAKKEGKIPGKDANTKQPGKGQFRGDRKGPSGNKRKRDDEESDPKKDAGKRHRMNDKKGKPHNANSKDGKQGTPQLKSKEERKAEKTSHMSGIIQKKRMMRRSKKKERRGKA